MILYGWLGGKLEGDNVYWIANLVEGRFEVYTEPTGPAVRGPAPAADAVDAGSAPPGSAPGDRPRASRPRPARFAFKAPPTR